MTERSASLPNSPAGTVRQLDGRPRIARDVPRLPERDGTRVDRAAEIDEDRQRRGMEDGGSVGGARIDRQDGRPVPRSERQRGRGEQEPISPVLPA